ncbi:MAG: hypothetical protein HUU55_13670 [Myxococcales bacterium]|nr:hypothetical protein [Myxococcales bacterium]
MKRNAGLRWLTILMLSVFFLTPAMAQTPPVVSEAPADVIAKGKELATKICTIVVGEKRDEFEALLHSDVNAKENMHYWWDINGKIGDWNSLYDSCEFSHVSKESTLQNIRVFIKRTAKRGGKGMPVPVVFAPDPKADNAYRITVSSL